MSRGLDQGGSSGGEGVDAGEAPEAGGIGDAASTDDAGDAAVALPPANAMFDYQLGEAYGPPVGVQVVVRDREADPAPAVYSICYVNGFQVQPGEEPFWLDEHPELILRDARGEPIVDTGWGEMLLDVSSPARRSALAEIVGGWIDGCANDGFDAIEVDNLDSHLRSGGRISLEDAVAFMRLLSDGAHARGLAIAQKNAAELLGRRREMATDFVVAEECNRYDECQDFVDVYGDQVYVVEYARGDFEKGCRDFPHLSVVLRDLLLLGPSASSYVYDGC